MRSVLKNAGETKQTNWPVVIAALAALMGGPVVLFAMTTKGREARRPAPEPVERVHPAGASAHHAPGAYYPDEPAPSEPHKRRRRRR